MKDPRVETGLLGPEEEGCPGLDSMLCAGPLCQTNREYKELRHLNHQPHHPTEIPKGLGQEACHILHPQSWEGGCHLQWRSGIRGAHNALGQLVCPTVLAGMVVTGAG